LLQLQLTINEQPFCQPSLICKNCIQSKAIHSQLPVFLVFCSTECYEYTNYIHEPAYDTALCVSEISINRYKSRVIPIFAASTLPVILNKIIVSSEEQNYSAAQGYVVIQIASVELISYRNSSSTSE
jgi:hypothetical protein